MSTSYHALRAPIEYIERSSPRAVLYDMHGDGKWLGSLHEACLTILADRDAKVAHRDNDGDIVVTHPGPDDMQAISEYGELVTLGQLRRGEAP